MNTTTNTAATLSFDEYVEWLCLQYEAPEYGYDPYFLCGEGQYQ